VLLIPNEEGVNIKMTSSLPETPNSDELIDVILVYQNSPRIIQGLYVNSFTLRVDLGSQIHLRQMLHRLLDFLFGVFVILELLV